MIQSLNDLLHREPLQPAGRQLDGQRQPIEAEAQPRHVRGIAIGKGEVGGARGGSIDQELHRAIARQVSVRDTRSGSGTSSDATTRTTSPAAPRGSRLVASRTTVVVRRRRSSTIAATSPIMCSQLSITTSARRSASTRATDATKSPE